MEAAVPLIETMVPPTVGSRPLARKIVLAGASAGAWLLGAARIEFSARVAAAVIISLAAPTTVGQRAAEEVPVQDESLSR